MFEEIEAGFLAVPYAKRITAAPQRGNKAAVSLRCFGLQQAKQGKANGIPEKEKVKKFISDFTNRKTFAIIMRAK